MRLGHCGGHEMFNRLPGLDPRADLRGGDTKGKPWSVRPRNGGGSGTVMSPGTRNDRKLRQLGQFARLPPFGQAGHVVRADEIKQFAPAESAAHNRAPYQS